jgi:hypothetical protein
MMSAKLNFILSDPEGIQVCDDGQLSISKLSRLGKFRDRIPQ